MIVSSLPAALFRAALSAFLLFAAFSGSSIFSPLQAKTCSSQAVAARGEPASLTWLARAKAKANWRAKVRALPDLGDPYANWERAEDATEHCVSGPSGTICDLSGLPCRKD